MKSISIYTITRNQNIECLQKLERQLSGRTYFLKMREWELESMKALVRELEVHMQDVHALRFFYSFQVPRLGKEFDLLQIKDDQIVNIELKSGKVSDEAVRKQLLQNRYYLSVQGKMIQSYTYISSQERLVRLNNHDHIVEADWDQLCLALQRQSKDYEGDIEDLFQAEMYLFSPVTEPERFLNKEYFLTSQQKDIERRILDKIRKVKYGYFWFSGLPGTGKTLLLYDIAMKLSVHQKVCMIHCGETGKKWKILHDRLLRIAFLSDSQLEECPDLKEYSAILVDEAHLLSVKDLHRILELSEKHPVIFSSDDEDMISDEEMDRTMIREIEHLPDIQSFHLTNRIRTNAELSSFIQNMMHLPEKRMVRYYPHIQVVYANDDEEAGILLKGYQNQLVFIIDERYYYDEKGYLRGQRQKQQEPTAVRMLFHRLNEAREEFAIIVKGNEAVYEVLLDLLQFSKKETVKTIAE
ncbi:AAA family ATPase [Blautia glucerasea]|uniref:AAA family ATPase n=1 Tax=Blautia glucerasea TaxID=536633 RepID=UPI001D079129|nr:AAA family ATPase [Blautia glucerasea]MCB6544815.1 AAA family ATPase [Blautia glucerasea]